MNDYQIILNDIADKIEKEELTVKKAKNRLFRAGILDKKGNITEPYKEVFKKIK